MLPPPTSGAPAARAAVGPNLTADVAIFVLGR
jgi:hypothetical protein